MIRLTATQGRLLVQFVASMRRDWHPAGIEAAVRKAAETAPGPEVAVAAVRVAADPDARTPGVIPLPGPHWQGTTYGQRPVPPPCPFHPDHPGGRCPECRAQATPPPPGWRNHQPTTTTATEDDE